MTTFPILQLSSCCSTCRDRCCVSVNGIGCKQLTPTGCKLSYSERGDPCKVYPFVKYDNELFLDTKCPAWREFGDRFAGVIK